MPLDPSKIIARRESLKLSQQDAAALAGMHRSAWARVESGQQTNAKLDTAEAIAKALRVPLGKIVA